MITSCFSEPDEPGPGFDTVNAIVQYTSPKKGEQKSAAVIKQPTSQNTSPGTSVQCFDMPNAEFKPVPAIAAPEVVDHKYYLRNNIEIGDWRLERGFLNASTFRPNLKNPSLHRTLDGLQTNNESFTDHDGVNEIAFNLKNELTIQHSGIKVVDLVLQNFDEGNHPLHLHGHKFWVLGQGHGYFPGYDALDLDLSNPIRRDTSALEGYGWILLRFITDNPGMWAFHCHLSWHSEAGLAMQFLSQPEVMAKWELPEANKQLCEAEGLERGAAPKDEEWFGYGIGR
jgi:FtsP/CotA-like multicopper oxidase with cupredoxin domain